MINDLPGETTFNSRGVELERECPACGEWIGFGSCQTQATCPGCLNTWVIDYDAEFVDGSWRDLTKLIPAPRTKCLEDYDYD